MKMASRHTKRSPTLTMRVIQTPKLQALSNGYNLKTDFFRSATDIGEDTEKLESSYSAG